MNQDEVFHIVVNPSGASGHTGKNWEKAEEVFRKSGKPFAVHFSTPEKGIEEICRELTGDGKKTTLVIVGGDGSLNQAVNGIRDLKNTKVGFIPAGSANDLARELGMDMDPCRNAERILRADTVRLMDVGEVEFLQSCGRIDPISGKEAAPEKKPFTRRFNSGCGIGFDAAICREVMVSPLKSVLNKLHLGKLIYIAVAIRLIFSFRKFDTEMELDGERILKWPHTLLCVGMEHRYEGGGFMFCPDADDTDGLLDICVGNPSHTAAFFRIFPSAYKGRHVSFDCVHMEKAGRVHIRTDQPAWVQTDGEPVCRSSEIRLGTAEDQLRFLF